MTTGEASSVSVNPLWDLLQNWIDDQPIPPNPAKVAKALGVVQSTFDTWKAPSEMPRRRNLWRIHELTRVPFKTVVDAAIEAVDLYNPRRAEQAANEHEDRKAKKNLKAVESGDAGEVPPPLGG